MAVLQRFCPGAAFVNMDLVAQIAGIEAASSPMGPAPRRRGGVSTATQAPRQRTIDRRGSSPAPSGIRAGGANQLIGRPGSSGSPRAAERRPR